MSVLSQLYIQRFISGDARSASTAALRVCFIDKVTELSIFNHVSLIAFPLGFKPAPSYPCDVPTGSVPNPM
jgi:hypothetical protein